MDNKKLIAFCKTNPYAMRLILELAEEYKPKSVTNVSEAVSLLIDVCDISVNYSQVTALFRQLEKLECGWFCVGRKGKYSRFRWTIDIKETGKLLANSSSDTPPTSKPSAHSRDSAQARSEAIRRHTFHLRQDFELVLSLPADLTEKEAQRIAKFVESLPQ